MGFRKAPYHGELDDGPSSDARHTPQVMIDLLDIHQPVSGARQADGRLCSDASTYAEPYENQTMGGRQQGLPPKP